MLHHWGPSPSYQPITISLPLDNQPNTSFSKQMAPKMEGCRCIILDIGKCQPYLVPLKKCFHSDVHQFSFFMRGEYVWGNLKRGGGSHLIDPKNPEIHYWRSPILIVLHTTWYRLNTQNVFRYYKWHWRHLLYGARYYHISICWRLEKRFKVIVDRECGGRPSLAWLPGVERAFIFSGIYLEAE